MSLQLPGGFRAVRLLEQTDQYQVVLATSPTSSEPRVLKLYQLDSATFPHSASRFDAELSVLGSIKHPQIVSLYAFGIDQDGGRGYLVLEYLAGPTIRSVSQVAPRALLSNLMLQAVRAVEALHRRHLVHGDLKSDHFLLQQPLDQHDQPARLKLIDMATVSSGQATSHRLERCITPQYAAPEVMAGEAPTTYSDIYSLGLVLLECLAPEELVRSYGLREPAQIAGRLSASYSSPSFELDILRLAQQMTCDRPQQRPSNVAAIAANIGRLMESHNLHIWQPNTLSEYFAMPVAVGLEALRLQFEAALTRIRATSGTRMSVAVFAPPGGGLSRALLELKLACAAHRIPGHYSAILATSRADTTLDDPPALVRLVTCSCREFADTKNDHIPLPNAHDSTRLLVIGHSHYSPSPCESHVSTARTTLTDSTSFTSESLTHSTLSTAIARTLGIRSVPEGLAARVLSASGGNPARAWLYFRYLIDSAQVSLTGEHLSLADLGMGDTAALLAGTSTASAVASLNPALLSLAQSLALSRIALTIPDLTILSERSSSDVTDALGQLLQSGLVTEDSGEGSHTYTCAGSLVALLLLTSVLPGQRKHLHSRLAEVLASGAPEWKRLHAAAHHATEAGAKATAMLHFSIAAERATASHDHSGAISCYESALALSRPESPPSVTLLLGLSRAYSSRGLLRNALDTLGRIAVKEIKDPRERCEVLMLTSKAHYALDSHVLAARAARRALVIARKHSWVPFCAMSMTSLGAALVWLDHHRRGVAILLKAARLARQVNQPTILSAVLGELSFSRWKAGRYRLARSYEKRRLRILSRLGHSREAASAAMNLGIVAADLGLYRSARRSYKVCLMHTRASGSLSLRASFLINLGETYRVGGAWRVSYQMYSSAQALIQSSGEQLTSAVAATNRARVLCKSGYLGTAIRILRSYRSSSQFSATSVSRMIHLLHWGQIFNACGAAEKARRVFLMASMLAKKSHQQHTILEARTGLAESLYDQGHTNRAVSLLARTISRDALHSPHEAVASAELTLLRFRVRSEGTAQTVLQDLKRSVANYRLREMNYHLGEALLEMARLRLELGQKRSAERACREVLRLVDRFGGKTLAWQAHEMLGKCLERALQLRRAHSEYRCAALLVREIAADIQSRDLRHAFLHQPAVQSVIAHHSRTKDALSRRARYDVAALNRREAVSRKMLASLSEIGQKLASTLELAPLLSQILDLAIENTGAERGVIFLREEASGEFRPESARGVGGLDLDDLSKFSRSVLKQAAEGRTLLTVDVGQDPLLQQATSITVNEIKSILCVPMRARGRVAGVLYLDTQRRQQLFTEKDRAFVETFAGQAAVAIENARLFGSIRAENGRLRREMTGRFKGMLGTSDAIGRLRDLLVGVADSESTILLTGESGTGKEVVARAIHLDGRRAGARFIPVDCGALPEHLHEAELFGCRRGAFTGADRDRAGLIEAANGGTLFLDEITNTSLALQARLLRVLQEREIRRLGETEARKVDVRIIAATNAEIEKLVSAGKFREDLYYRLNVVRVEVPPLRDRRDDVPLLAEHFLERQAAAGKAGAPGMSEAGDDVKPKRFGPGVLDALSLRDWPGNVRELENMVERLRVLTHGSLITLADLARIADGAGGSEKGTASPKASGRLLAFPGAGNKTGEQLMIEDALRRCQGDKAKAARFIGWNRQKLYRRLKAFAIPADFGKAA